MFLLNKIFRRKSVTCRYIVLSLIALFFLVKNGTAQGTSFVYTLSSAQPIGINDVVESNDGYVMVGWQNSTDGWPYPYFFSLDVNGNFVSDSLLNIFKGYFSYISLRDNGYILAFTQFDADQPEQNNLIVSAVIATDDNFQFTDALGGQRGSIQNCKGIDDNTLAVIGKDDLEANTHIATLKLYNLNEIEDGNEYTNIFLSEFPVEFYDILKVGATWRIFVNSPDSSIPGTVYMFTLNSNFNLIDGFPDIATSYTDFNAESKFIGPVTAMSLTDSTFIIHGAASHPVYENEEKTIDAATVVWNADNTELQLNFAGVPDTNAFASRHSIAKNDESFYFGDTKNYDVGIDDQISYFMLTKTDLSGTVLWTKYYGNDSNLKLTNVIATADGGALMVGDSYFSDTNEHKIYVVKIDEDGILNAVENPGEPTFSSYVFPNPSSSEIHFSLPELSGQNIMLEVYDSLGKLVLRKSYQEGESLNVSDYDSGVYLYRLRNDKLITSGKFIVGK